MKRGKRVAAVTLAIGVAVTGSMAPFAANDKGLPEGNYGGVTGGNANSVLTGTIKITNIQVKVPAKASFDTDSNVIVTAGGMVVTSPDADNTNRIIIQASNYTVVNTSKIPLVVSITGVKTDTGDRTAEDTPKLVNAMDELAGTSVMFAICENGDSIIYPAAEADNTGKWMTKTTVTTGSPYSMAKTPNDNILVPEGTLNMTLCGATGAGWKNGQSFRVIPTLTVALQSSQSKNHRGEARMATRIPCTPFGKRMKTTMVEQDIPQQELAKRLGIANSTVSGIIHGRNQCERTKERIAETLSIQG